MGKKIFKKVLLFSLGSIILISGITLILTQWGHIIQLFKGTIGIFFALIGFFILMAVKE